MPPRRKPTPATEEKLDDLLDFEKTAEEAKSASTKDESTSSSADEETPEKKKIAELEKKIASANDLEKTNPVTDSGQPKPESALTTEQKRIRELEDQLAKTEARIFEERGLVEEDSEDGTIIHILEDGFTAQGIVFYRGQQIQFGPRATKQTQNVDGVSWLDLDDSAQMRKYGRVMFRKGPWPGTSYDGEAAGKSNQANAPVVNL